MAAGSWCSTTTRCESHLLHGHVQHARKFSFRVSNPQPGQEESMSRKVYVVGVGMTPFTKPGAGEAYPTLGARAARAALEDAGVDSLSVDQAYVAYVYGDSCSGQAAIYHLG